MRTVADLLKQLVLFESRKIEEQGISHAPSIGAMYEGLTREVLERALPFGTDLRVVSGFIRWDDDTLSSQIDCMIVNGEGLDVPHADFKIWPIAGVLAIVEVKKNLQKEDLRESLEKSRAISSKALDRFERRRLTERLELPLDAFSTITGVRVDTAEGIRQLPIARTALLLQLCAEMHTPIRVIFGYAGYGTENGLRRAMADVILEKNVAPCDVPQLVAAGGVSLVKLNGQPFSASLGDGLWHILASTDDNPLLLLMELLWARTTAHYAFAMTDDDLKLTPFTPLLSAIFDDSREAWALHLFDVPSSELSARTSGLWEPQIVTEHETTLLMMLLEHDHALFSDDWLSQLAHHAGLDPTDLAQPLIDKRFLAWLDEGRTGVALRLSRPIAFMFAPDGTTVAADAHDDRMATWILQRFKE